jgi:large subunit ribosomal protein L13
MERATHTIDASQRSIGDVATQAVRLLRGKHKPTFRPHEDAGDVVLVQNIKNVKITGRKLEQKRYYRHSGYLGGIKSASLKEVFSTKPEEVLRKAVLGMLPKNRLRPLMIKRLKIES